MLKILCGLTLISLVACSSDSSNSPEVAALENWESTTFDSALTLYQQKQYAPALQIWQSLEDDNVISQDAMLYFYMGMCQWKQDSLSLAEESFGIASEKSSKDPVFVEDAQLKKGIVIYDQGTLDSNRYQDAYNYLNSIHQDISNTEIHSSSLLFMGKSAEKLLWKDSSYMEKAHIHFEEVYNDFTNTTAWVQAAYQLGHTYYQKDDFAKCKKVFGDQLSVDSGSSFLDNGLYFHGRCSFESNDNITALNSFNRLEKEFPKSRYFDNAFFWVAKTKWLLALESQDSLKAMELHQASNIQLQNYLQAYPLGIYQAEAKLILGQNNFEMGNFSTAKKHLLDVINLHVTSPEVPVALYYLGRTEMAENNFEQAIAWFRQLQKNHPQSDRIDDAGFQIGKSLYRLGEPIDGEYLAKDSQKLNEAIQELNTTLNKFPNTPKKDNILLYLVRSHSEVEQCNDANKSLELMQTEFPNSKLTLYALNHSSFIQNCGK